MIAAQRDQETAGKTSLVIAVPRLRPSYSETFIQEHLSHLESESRYFFSPWFLNPVLLSRKSDEWENLPRPARYFLQAAARPFLDICEDLHTAALKKFLKHHNPGAVLAEFGPVGVSVMEACRAARIPFVVHFHGFDASKRSILLLYQRAYKKMFQQASSIIAVSKDMKKKLIQIGAPEDKVILNPYGVDTARFSGANPAKAPARFLAIGRFVEKKGPHFTLLAFKRMLREEPRAELVMAGKGQLLKFCKLLTAELGLNNSVSFPGVLPQDEIIRLMRTSRAFVQHSVTADCGDSEGTPVAILEAQAAGLPVIATRHAGIKDVVIEERTGLLVEEEDVEGMARQMLRLARDEQEAEEMGIFARVRIQNSFSKAMSFQRLRETLRSAARAGFKN